MPGHFDIGRVLIDNVVGDHPELNERSGMDAATVPREAPAETSRYSRSFAAARGRGGRRRRRARVPAIRRAVRRRRELPLVEEQLSFVDVLRHPPSARAWRISGVVELVATLRREFGDPRCQASTSFVTTRRAARRSTSPSHWDLSGAAGAVGGCAIVCGPCRGIRSCEASRRAEEDPVRLEECSVWNYDGYVRVTRSTRGPPPPDGELPRRTRRRRPRAGIRHRNRTSGFPPETGTRRAGAGHLYFRGRAASSEPSRRGDVPVSPRRHGHHPVPVSSPSSISSTTRSPTSPRRTRWSAALRKHSRPARPAW